MLTINLKFSKHVEKQVNKANRMLGLIRRSYEYLDNQSLKSLFCALVRPHLEFANTAWSPRFEKDKQLIEGVLRRATKIIPCCKTLDYEERLRKLDIPSMAYRRIRGDMIETYKYVHNLYNCEVPFVLDGESITRGHSFKLKKLRCNSSLRQSFFSQRVVDSWNNLSNNIASAPSLNCFKARFDATWSDIKYTQHIDLPLKK